CSRMWLRGVFDFW
nr:immunoglobulin heavy chain junction region [Macaca mulatta]